MAKLSEYPAKAAADNSDIIPLVDAGGNKKITKENLLQGLPTATSVAIAAETAKGEAIQQGVGVGQTYQDVILERSVDVVYTNTTSKPITVYIQGWAAIENLTNKSFEIDGVGVAIIFGHGSHAMRATISAIVPAGSTYRVSDANDITVLTWVELR